MKQRRHPWRALVGLVALLSLAGCSGSSQTRQGARSPSSGSSATTKAPTTTTSPPEPPSALVPGSLISTTLTPVASRPAPGPARSNLAALQFLNGTVGYSTVYGCPGCQAPLDATTDGGLEWARISSPTGAAAADSAFDVRVGLRQLWLFGPRSYNSLGNAAFRSLDGGHTWDQLVGLDRLIDLAIEPDGLWALIQRCDPATATPCQTALATSADEGVTWTVAPHQPQIAPATPSQPTQAVLQLLRMNDSDAWVLSLNSVASSSFVLSRTTDGGAHWTSSAAPAKDCAGSPAALAGYNPEQLWLACGGNPATDMEQREVARSEDGGLTWQVTFSGTAGGQMQDLAVASPASAFLGECRNTLEGSFDGGRTWVPVIPLQEGDPIDGCLGPVFFTDPSHGWAGGQNAQGRSLVWRTSNGGRSWTSTPLP